MRRYLRYRGSQGVSCSVWISIYVRHVSPNRQTGSRSAQQVLLLPQAKILLRKSLKSPKTYVCLGNFFGNEFRKTIVKFILTALPTLTSSSEPGPLDSKFFCNCGSYDPQSVLGTQKLRGNNNPQLLCTSIKRRFFRRSSPSQDLESFFGPRTVFFLFF